MFVNVLQERTLHVRFIFAYCRCLDMHIGLSLDVMRGYWLVLHLQFFTPHFEVIGHRNFISMMNCARLTTYRDCGMGTVCAMARVGFTSVLRHLGSLG